MGKWLDFGYADELIGQVQCWYTVGHPSKWNVDIEWTTGTWFRPTKWYVDATNVKDQCKYVIVLREAGLFPVCCFIFQKTCAQSCRAVLHIKRRWMCFSCSGGSLLSGDNVNHSMLMYTNVRTHMYPVVRFKNDIWPRLLVYYYRWHSESDPGRVMGCHGNLWW